MDFERWRLLIIDNASAEPLSNLIDLSWHPNGRVIREESVGLIHARLRAFRETSSPLVVFSDDDNELAPDYLQKAWDVYGSFPHLGAFGACISCEYEEPIEAPDELIHVFGDPNGGRGSSWGNDPWHPQSNPIGAGLCLRREICASYLSAVEGNPDKLGLGRTGNQLLSFEDTDLVHHACQLGFGKGILAELKLVHLIPSKRTTLEYLVRLTEGHAFSEVLFRYQRGSSLPRSGISKRIKNLVRIITASGPRRALILADLRGRQRAESMIFGRESK